MNFLFSHLTVDLFVKKIKNHIPSEGNGTGYRYSRELEEFAFFSFSYVNFINLYRDMSYSLGSANLIKI